MENMRKLVEDFLPEPISTSPLFKEIKTKKEEGPIMMFISPEDFERFQKGEMTKEELLKIKKAVDTVAKAKTKYKEEK